jgi:4Fe-4S ferredoxin
MTTRGTTLKRETSAKQTLMRPMITRRYVLEADHQKCCGCGTCAKVCPREAITLSAAQLSYGRLKAKPRVDIDAQKCSFCGECVAMCPMHALDITVNGQPENPVIKGEAFPLLIRTHKTDPAPCRATTDTSYVDNCPVGAISVQAQRNAEGRVVAVEDVSVDKKVCVNCTRCMEEGPQGAFTVTKPYEGRTFLQISRCPSGCQACADACPTHAITYDGVKVNLDQRFCLFCGACENVCPSKANETGPGAVRIVRTGFKHMPIQSGAWTVALDKLVSYQAVSREYDIKGQEKRRKLLLAGLHLETGETGKS